MKPEDLKPPFPRDDRRVVMHDRVWYVPERTLSVSDFAFPGWDHSDFFGNTQPVIVEYCSGNGAWIAAKAQGNPHLNWVAVEKKFERVRKIWSKIKNGQLNNLIVLCGEAHQATRRFIPDNTVSEIYINFPDPWPKTRHFKHRLIQDPFAQEMWRILKQNCGITFVTDDPPYSEWFIQVMGSHSGFKSHYSAPFYTTDVADYGTSYFDELWRGKGRQIRHHRFQKT